MPILFLYQMNKLCKNAENVYINIFTRINESTRFVWHIRRKIEYLECDRFSSYCNKESYYQNEITFISRFIIALFC